MANVATRCPNCGADSRTEYHLIGAPAACGSCGNETVPIIPVGTQIPYHQWDLTFADFRRLVEDPACRPEIAPLLDNWFGYRIVGAGDETSILTAENERIDPLRLHLEIQSDPDKQYKLYQTAMGLWR